MIFESLQYYSEMICMIMITVGIDKNVIYEDYDEHAKYYLNTQFIKSMKATGVLLKPNDMTKNLK